MNADFLIDHEPTADPDRHVIRALLKIEGTAPSDDNRIPLNLSVVLDNSGSMMGPKLSHARDAAVQLLAGVHPTDTTSVVTFETAVDVVAPAAPRGSQTDLSSRVARIDAGGATNLSGGWLEGRAQVSRHHKDEQSNRIVIMTDGHANRGITDPRELTALFDRARSEGITTSTIGFGRDFDEDLLATLADAGGGNTYYIENPDQAPDVFRAELQELLTLSAQNLTAEIRLEDGVEIAAVHHTYPREDDRGVLRLRLGDLYASEPKQLLVELGAHAVGSAPTSLASIIIRADVLTEDGGMERREITLPLSFSPATGPVVNAEVRRTLIFLEAATTRRAAVEDQRHGRHEEGARKLRHAAQRVREVADDETGREEADDLQRMARVMEERTVSAHDVKYMAARSHSAGRSKLGHAAFMSRKRREERGEARKRAGRTEPTTKDDQGRNS